MCVPYGSTYMAYTIYFVVCYILFSRACSRNALETFGEVPVAPYCGWVGQRHWSTCNHLLFWMCAFLIIQFLRGLHRYGRVKNTVRVNYSFDG